MKNVLRGLSVSLIALSANFAAHADEDDFHGWHQRKQPFSISYVQNSLTESQISFGPWTLHQSGYLNYDASGIVPTTAGPPYSGSGTPYVDLCNGKGKFTKNEGKSLMQPFYFPFVRSNGEFLEGYFDYRPRNEQEALVAAISFDWGATWTYTGEALALNPYCPWDPTDPDNQNVSVDGVKTAYGSSSANAADNGLGHANILSVHGKRYLYQLNRANNHIDSDQLVVHKFTTWQPTYTLAGQPKYGYVSPLASGGYPTLESTATATSGLINPDAILGSTTLDGTTTIVYVSKTLNGDTAFPIAQQCAKTPSYALTNLVNGKARSVNHDVIAIRIATTTDGINFTDVGAATGLNDPTTVAFNGIRWLGSGSIISLADGRYGMFFGAGNCLDNDSDGFHFIGYAETTGVVNKPSDLLNWDIVYGLDNPILSTDTVTDPAGPRPYPANAPIVSVTGADALTSAQVAPFAPPAAGYNTNFFSGRVYDPQAIVTNSETVTIVFAGYNTPQPSNNLGDYRTIGRVQVKFPRNYLSPFQN